MKNVCRVCLGASLHPVMEPEGGSVCLACIYRLGRAAGFPDTLSVMEAIALEEQHGDVVTIEPGGTGFVWVWR